MIGTHTATVGGVDISCLIDTIEIHHGRDDTDTQPDASTATVNLSFDTVLEDLPPEVEIGAALVVTTTIPGPVASVRFSGAVTDLVIGWDDQAEDSPNAAVVQIIAAGPLADLGRRVVGDAPFPQELDGARVSRVFALAGVVLDPLTSDPGTVQILPRDIDAQAALGVAQEAATSAGGIVWQTRDGLVRYADAEHRRRTAATLGLDACDVLITPQWRRDTGGLVNAVSIGYGVAPEGGEQPRFADDRPDSQTRYGFYEISVATVLAALADAQAMATLLLTRNAFPVWVLSELPVAVADLDLADTAALLALDMHSLVGLTGLPIVGALPTNTSLWVEGWAESLAAGSHDFTLAISGYCRTSPPPRWDDLDPALTWDTTDPALTWDDAACFGPTPSLGRWADVPASYRWDTLSPAITWDTWPY